MLKKILASLSILLVCFLTYVAMKPTAMVVSREITINAAPESIFPHINNSKKANDWMPWQCHS